MSPIWRKEHELARTITHWIGMGIFAIGLTAFLGHLSGQASWYSWGRIGAMAMPSSFTAMLSGIGFFLVSRGEAPHGDGN